jgi:transcriptional regulator with XRE-family HTH domain
MDARRGQIRGLLRAARARVNPEEVGFCRTGRRKVPGLRREDIAVLAQVSLKWYTWLEQGRDLNFSDDLLMRVSRVLRLSSCEQDYLFALTRRRHPPTMSNANTATDWLRRTVQFAPVPVLAMTLRWDIVAWNHLMTRVFRDYGLVPLGERNLLRIILTDERYRADAASFERIVRQLLGEFRVDFGAFAGDPRFQALIAELHEAVPDFERYWNAVELWGSPRGTFVEHQELGDLYFDRISYIPEHHASTRILTFIPGEPNTARVIASLRPAIAETPVPLNVATMRESYLLRNRH